ncbi:low molecular weight protein-tyrosine-phosphatase [Azospirillum sp. B506]|uniref:low molecular weight protein-tyrosine-phosphatase n=1 Tax=Azospirillum sp. B506 TaxID=137721 RepID=UPI0005B2AF17|nr:low molecular weight protein-tyrosine-phosphatase [Azospirillum sp. B506]
MTQKAPVLSVLFVCTGNICRSPTAEGLFRTHLRRAGIDDRVCVDSAGTHGYHVGEPPDPRSVEAARRRGVDISRLRARQVAPEDFERFDVILALDHGHLRQLKRLAPMGRRDRVLLFLDFTTNLKGQDVPDPYYGDEEQFDRVLDVIDAGAQALLKEVESRLA